MLETTANLCQIACLLSSQCDSYLGLNLDRENKVKMEQSDAMMHFNFFNFFILFYFFNCSGFCHTLK